MPTLPNTDEVERLVALFYETLKGTDQFEARDALSAAMTFTYRLGRSIVALVPKEDREEQGQIISQSFQRVAAMIAFDSSESAKERVH